MPQFNFAINRLAYETTLKALQARTNGKLNSSASTAVLSLMALGLTGCGGGGTTVPQFSQGGTAVKGPLSNATVFIDLDGDGKLDSNEISTTTNSDGTYSFSTTDQAKLAGDIIVTTNDNTVDASSGEVLAGVTLKATAGSEIVSPATTLVKAIVDANTSTTQTAEQKLAAAQTAVKTALGITDTTVDLTTFNPFNTTDTATAKEVEAAAQKVVAIVNSISEAADASGADKDAVFSKAIETLGTEFASASGDLLDSTNIATTINKVVSGVTGSGTGELGITISGVADIALAVENVSNQIDAALASPTATLEDAREVFSVAQAALTDAAVGSATGDSSLTTLLKTSTDVTAIAAAPTVSGTVRKTVLESDVAISSTGSLLLTDNDTTDVITYQFKAETLAPLNTSSLGGTLSIDADGNWTYSLDLTADASKNALMQALQSEAFEGDLNPATTTTPADFSVVERFKVIVQQVDANGIATPATYDGTTTPITKIITVVIGGVNDAVEATTATISDVANAAQHTAITSIDTSNYFTDAEADAGNGDVIAYTDSDTLPEGLSIDPATGIISGTPSANALGEYTVVVTATDIAGTSATQTFKITVANVNDVPTVVAATADQTTNEDALFTLDTSTAFGDADIQFNDNAANNLANEVLTYAATLEDGSVLPTWLTFNTTTGVLSGTPANDDVGEISVKVTATDIASTSVSDIFKITVANTNDAPTASDKTDVTLGDLNTLTIDTSYLTGKIADVDVGDTLKVTSVTVTSGGGSVAETSAGSGVWTYTPPDVDADTAVILKYIVADVAGSTATANIEVNVVDAIPLGTILEDNTINVDTMLANAAAELSVAVGNLSLALASAPDTNLSGVYDPGTNVNGTISFVIKQSGVDNLPAVLEVTKVDDVATIDGDKSKTTDEDTVATGTLTGTDTADGLTDGTLWTVKTDASNGTATIDAATGAWSYTPDANYNGSDSFIVTLTDDDGHTLDQTVSLTVNSVDDVVAVSGDTSKTANEDTTFNGTLVAVDDADGLTDATYFSIANGNGASHGTASINAETGAWTYTPTANYFGSDSFVVTITDDDGYTKNQTIVLNVTSVNDVPLAAAKTGITLGDSTTLEINASYLGSLISDADTADTLKITALNVDSTYGSVAETSTGSGNWIYTPAQVTTDTDVTLTYTISDGNGGTASSTISINVVDAIPVAAAIDEDTASVEVSYSGGVITLNPNQNAGTLSGSTFTPDANFNGTVEFTITLTDNTQLPGVLVINKVDDAATISGDSTANVAEDNIATGNLTGQDDADGLNDGTLWTVKTNGNNGTATISAANGDWSYAPNANFNGTDTFVVTLTDDDGHTKDQTVTVTVTSVDDAATITGDISGSGAEDGGAITGTMTATDAADGLTDKTYFTVSTAASNGTATINAETGAWSYTPATNYNGSDSFVVTVTDDDGFTKTQTVSLTVTQVDDEATIGGDLTGTGAEDGGAITGTMTATDSADGLTDSEYFTVTSAATNGTATIDPASGAWSYTPTADYNGSDQFTVTVTDDDGNTKTQVVSLTVTAVNDAATISGAITGAANEDNDITGVLIAVDSKDGLTDKTYFTVSTDASNGSATINAETGAWSYTPDANYNGTDSFIVTITDDDNHTETQTINLTVNAVDDAAVITGDISGSKPQYGGAITGDLNATDVEGLTDSTYFTVSTAATNGTATIDAATGAWSYTPTSGAVTGDDTFIVTVTDDLGGTTTQQIDVSVIALGDALTATKRAINADTLFNETGIDTGLTDTDTYYAIDISIDISAYTMLNNVSTVVFTLDHNYSASPFEVIKTANFAAAPSNNALSAIFDNDSTSETFGSFVFSSIADPAVAVVDNDAGTRTTATADIGTIYFNLDDTLTDVSVVLDGIAVVGTDSTGISMAPITVDIL